MYARIASSLCLVLGLGAASACGNQADNVREPDPADAQRRLRTSAQHMRDHFQQVALIRDAVVAGDLHAAREPAAWLADRGGPEQTPPSWEPHRAQMRTLAATVRDARRLDQAALATGTLAATCGSCHAEVGADVERDMPALIEPRDGGTATLMRRHKWGVDRLWEGLVIPSDAAWRIGSEVLRDAPLAPRDVAGDGPIDPRLAILIDLVHSLGTAAGTTTDPAERAALAGRLLGTCAGCHELAHVRHKGE